MSIDLIILYKKTIILSNVRHYSLFRLLRYKNASETLFEFCRKCNAVKCVSKYGFLTKCRYITGFSGYLYNIYRLLSRFSSREIITVAR